MTTAGEFCSRRVVLARRDEGLTDVARRMLDEHVGSVVVVDENESGQLRPVGMLTDRDIVVGALARNDRLDALTAGDVMSTELVTVRDHEPFEEVFMRMRSSGIRRVPVVNANEGLEGIVTLDHWLEFLEDQIVAVAASLRRQRNHEARTRSDQLPDTTLRRYTHVRTVVLAPDTDVYSAIRALEDNHIGAVIVHDGSGVVGIATDRDLALRVGSYNIDPTRAILADVMTTDVATLPVTASTGDAARLMRDRHVRRIPIVDESSIAGLVTLDDLIVDRAIDQETLAEIVSAQLLEPARHKPGGQIRPSAPVHP